MNAQTEERIQKLEPSSLNVLEISGSAWANYGFHAYQSVNWPDFDICKDRLPTSFDLIIAEQVFEHLRYPHHAARNIFRMLRGGATFLITTPFLIRLNPMPEDLWRWTPSGMKAFLEDAGFVSIEVGSWGNRECVIANLTGWPTYEPARHSLVSEEDVPVVVWATAKRAN